MLSLPCIEEPVYRKFANRLLSSQHRVIDESVFSYIYQQSGSVTWYVQAILHSIYEHGSYGITKSLVDKQLVSKTPKGYLVSDRFFAKWLVRGGITS